MGVVATCRGRPRAPFPCCQGGPTSLPYVRIQSKWWLRNRCAHVSCNLSEESRTENVTCGSRRGLPKQAGAPVSLLQGRAHVTSVRIAYNPVFKDRAGLWKNLTASLLSVSLAFVGVARLRQKPVSSRAATLGYRLHFVNRFFRSTAFSLEPCGVPRSPRGPSSAPDPGTRPCLEGRRIVLTAPGQSTGKSSRLPFASRMTNTGVCVVQAAARRDDHAGFVDEVRGRGRWWPGLAGRDGASRG